MPPIFANAYVYELGSDSIAPIPPATDAGGDVDLDNVIDPNAGPHTMRVGRTATSVAVGTGFTITLNVATTVSCVGLLNVSDDPLAAEQIQVIGKDGGAAVVFDTSSDLIRPPDVFDTDFAPTPCRPCWIAGVDDLATPAKGSPAALATWSCKTLEVQLGTAFTSYLEVAYVALGVDAIAFQDRITEGQISHEVAQLASGGQGYKLTIGWPRLRKMDFDALQALYSKAAFGSYPMFVFPRPASKAADGTLAGEEHSPATRGGLMRMTELSSSEFADYASGVHVTGARAAFESWQEVPIDG